MDTRGLWVSATQSTPVLAGKGKATPSRERRKMGWETSQPLGRETKHRSRERTASMRKEMERRQRKDWWAERCREEHLGVDTENSR